LAVWANELGAAESMAMTSKLGTISVIVVAGGAVLWAIQHRPQARLGEVNQVIRGQASQTEAIENDVASNGLPSGFVLEGNFEDTFAGKHHNAGSFTVRACGSSAVVDMLFENGYREITGTDGKDAFTYSPVPRALEATSSQALAAISHVRCSHGRFPTNAHLFAQALWLVCVRDPELVRALRGIRFPFYADYTEKEIIPLTKEAKSLAGVLSSVRWFAPTNLAVGSSRYPLYGYPNGWLIAELSTPDSSAIGGISLPSRIVYTHNKTKSTTNYLELPKLRNLRPTDVLPVEVAVFSVTNARTEQRLLSYIPEGVESTPLVIEWRKARGTASNER
jgi:hypothetical protein